MMMVRSWIYLVLFLIWTLFIAVGFLPSLVSARGALGSIRLWARGVKLLARTIVGVRFRVEGREHIPNGADAVGPVERSVRTLRAIQVAYGHKEHPKKCTTSVKSACTHVWARSTHPQVIQVVQRVTPHARQPPA